MKSPPRVCNKPTIKFIFVFCTLCPDNLAKCLLELAVGFGGFEATGAYATKTYFEQ